MEPVWKAGFMKLYFWLLISVNTCRCIMNPSLAGLKLQWGQVDPSVLSRLTADLESLPIRARPFGRTTRLIDLADCMIGPPSLLPRGFYSLVGCKPAGFSWDLIGIFWYRKTIILSTWMMGSGLLPNSIKYPLLPSSPKIFQSQQTYLRSNVVLWGLYTKASQEVRGS